MTHTTTIERTLPAAEVREMMLRCGATYPAPTPGPSALELKRRKQISNANRKYRLLRKTRPEGFRLQRRKSVVE